MEQLSITGHHHFVLSHRVHNLSAITTNSVEYQINVLYSESERPVDFSSVSNHVLTLANCRSAFNVVSNWGIIEYDIELSCS